jgi:hypothetical protein
MIRGEETHTCPVPRNPMFKDDEVFNCGWGEGLGKRKKTDCLGDQQ